jgi:hypothetical protein
VVGDAEGVMGQPRPHPTAAAPGLAISEWRRLAAAGFERGLAAELADEPAIDLHELLVLVDRGCPPALAAQILRCGGCPRASWTTRPSRL